MAAKNLREPRKLVQPQQFVNGEIHDWYRIVHGYSDHLVRNLIDKFKLSKKHRVLDPFCGAGTTLVECHKSGISCVGLDANPSSCFAAGVKTHWRVRPSKLDALVPQVAAHYKRLVQNVESLKTNPTYAYLSKAGMIERGWIKEQRLIKAIAIKCAINKLNVGLPYKNVLHLALITEVVNNASNVRFGPELYCGKLRKGVKLLENFAERVRLMSDALGIVRDMPCGTVRVFRGDARDCSVLLRRKGFRRFHAVICSPPYPAEHDYTRNSRLELAFLEAVSDRHSLRAIKKTMIRSHTKGIYSTDNDASWVEHSESIQQIASAIGVRAKAKTHGFARLYSKVLTEYFGGMKKHFDEVIKVLAPGARCAYVVGDQSSYLRVHVPTGKILSQLARDAGFRNVHLLPWRSRWSTTTSKMIAENILLMRKPKNRVASIHA
jgi:tRNA G10  N-methylase Trm11